MTAPRTLPALRAAIVRALDARGDSADGLRVTADRGEWITSIAIDGPAGQVWASGRDEAHAVARAWESLYDRVWGDACSARLARRVGEQAGVTGTALDALRSTEDRAQAMLRAVRDVEIEET